MVYILKKISTLIITLLAISMLTFVAFSLIPSDAAVTRLGTNATPEQVEALRQEMGLDQPIVKRYVSWLGGALRMDFGKSYQYENSTVNQLLADRLPTTLLLAGLALVFILVISLPLGILSARFLKKWPDVTINGLSQITMAIPPFFLGILMTYIFGLMLHWFQPGAFVSPMQNLGQSIAYLIFPAFAVALPKIGMVVKFLRASILGEMNKDYVRTARSKGCLSQRVLYSHVLKNAMIPVITFLAMVIAEILAGSIIVEQVFSVPGLGRLMIASIAARDYPVVQAIVIYITATVVIINFIVDILYRLIDPRVGSVEEGAA